MLTFETASTAGTLTFQSVQYNGRQLPSIMITQQSLQTNGTAALQIWDLVIYPPNATCTINAMINISFTLGGGNSAYVALSTTNANACANVVNGGGSHATFYSFADAAHGIPSTTFFQSQTVYFSVFLIFFKNLIF
jgi:hypothetical protein